MSGCTRQIEVDPKLGVPVVGRWYLSHAGDTTLHHVLAIRANGGDLCHVFTERWYETGDGSWQSDGQLITYPGEKTPSGTPYVDFTKPCDPPPGYEAIEYVPRKSDAEYLASVIPNGRVPDHCSFVNTVPLRTVIGIADVPFFAQAFRDAEKWKAHCVRRGEVAEPVSL